MKKVYLIFALLATIAISGFTVLNVSETGKKGKSPKVYTPGTLTFNITTTATGGYSPEHLIAIWIQDNATGTFVKTKFKYGKTSDSNSHLQTWVTNSASNTTDATTGATSLYNWNPITITWNGTNVAGSVVPDGTYKIMVEMAWGDSQTTGKTVVNYTFVKGTSEVTLTPTGDTHFSNLSIHWVPATTAVESPDVKFPFTVYPNPCTDFLTVLDTSDKTETYNYTLYDQSGKVVYQSISQKVSGEFTKEIELDNFAKGIYFLEVKTASKSYKKKIVVQ